MNEMINISGLRLEAPIMNGAGPVKTPDDVRVVATSRSAAVLVGSITLEERLGNEGDTYYMEPGGRFSMNSKGLPNGGLAYYLKNLPEMVRIAHDNGKPLLVSIAGFSPDEYKRISSEIASTGIDGIELNLGCPNVWGVEGKQKGIVGFNMDATSEILDKQQLALGSDFWVSMKPPPYSDPSQLVEAAKTFSRFAIVKGVTASNTFPNTAYFDQGKAVITPGGGFGGYAGEAIRPIALGQVMQFREALPARIGIIGVGGISQSRHLIDFLRAGASAAQVTTAYINEGPGVFARLRGI